MANRIQIRRAIKTGWVLYFKNFPKFIGRLVGFVAAMFVGLLGSSIVLEFAPPHAKVLARLILIGFLIPIAGTFVSLTFKLMGVRCRSGYPVKTIFGLGFLLSGVLVVASLTITFWMHIAVPIGVVVFAILGVAEIIFKALIVLSICFAIAEGLSMKESLCRAWSIFVSAPVNVIVFHLLAILVGSSGFILAGFGLLMTLPIGFTSWAVAYQQLNETPSSRESNSEIQTPTCSETGIITADGYNKP